MILNNMRIQIKDIELVYSEKQQQLIYRIKMIINNNYELISSSLGGNKIIDISQETIKKVLRKS